MAFNLSLSHPLCLPLSPQKHSGHTAKGTPKCIAVIFSPRDLRRCAFFPTPADAPLSYIQLSSWNHGWNTTVMLWCDRVQHVQKDWNTTRVSDRQKIRYNLTNSDWTRDYHWVLVGWVSFPHRLKCNTKLKGQVLRQTVWGDCNNGSELLIMLIKEIVFHKMNSWKNHKMADLLKLHKEFPIAACPVDIVQTFNILLVLQWTSWLSIC